MKKLLCFTLAAVCLFACLCGCDNTPVILKTAMSEGDFIYNLNDDGSGTAVILGFTEEGLQKEVLIVPETIGGYPVRNYGIDLLYSPLGGMQHDNLKRIYFPYFLEDIGNFAFQNNPKLEKIIVMNPSTWCRHVKMIMANINKYSVPGFANVSYYSENQFYWADDYEYGAKILYQPPEPVRSDAVFEGWYKEPECINPWNYDIDTLPEIAYNNYGDLLYQETILYAKWKMEESNS